MTQSSVVSSGESTPSIIEEKPAISNKDTLLAVCAKDIMQKDVVWANPDDSVQQALAKIQQHGAGYIMIGQGQVPEGIISKSDLTGALSPYLRSVFVKWRRPMDDATLRIRIKWIMSKCIHTIGPDTPLTEIMEHMCQSGIRCLPVVDEQGTVQGLVTVFDIFRALLKHSLAK
jgi:CBS-domain-containing membrane protein